MTFFDQELLLQKMSEYEMDREYRRRAGNSPPQIPPKVVSLAIEKRNGVIGARRRNQISSKILVCKWSPGRPICHS